MIFDFDDFSQTHDCRDKLEELKSINPDFKVSLFTVPGDTTLEMLKWANNDWVELVPHGWLHESNYECEKWSYKHCKRYLYEVTKYDIFVDGFKAPGWQISNECYQALIDYDFWVADQDYNDDRRPERLPVYKVGEDSYHGHTWDCGCNNGIYEDWNNISKLVKNAKEFKFISEVVQNTVSR